LFETPIVNGNFTCFVAFVVINFDAFRAINNVIQLSNRRRITSGNDLRFREYVALFAELSKRVWVGPMFGYGGRSKVRGHRASSRSEISKVKAWPANS